MKKAKKVTASKSGKRFGFLKFGLAGTDYTVFVTAANVAEHGAPKGPKGQTLGKKSA
jgi:hypothetical protein